MSNEPRGADIVVQTLERAGCRNIFTLSGNHIMPIFDAAFGSSLRLLHVRHEAAAVHMADAWARLTGQCGIALVSGGAGHANAVAALCTAKAADSPVLLLSGHAGLAELGRGAFQELRQADMAAPVTKASWTVQSLATLGEDIARAMGMALSGRPGPVHVSLPYDLLEARAPAAPPLPDPAAFVSSPCPLDQKAAKDTLAILQQAQRPLILSGPVLCHADGPKLMRQLAETTGVPCIGMESPRGVNDPRLGAFGEVLREADVIVLLAKPQDFTLRFADAPAVHPECRIVVLDPDVRLIERVRREKGNRLALGAIADPVASAEALIGQCPASLRSSSTWRRTVGQAVAYRPASWSIQKSSTAGKVHPLEMCRAIAPYVGNRPNAILVCDGGEIGQWPQAALAPNRRVINGVAGSIGASVPFALAARAAEPSAPVIAVMGDGSFGFHMAEFDTAVRHGLPFVAVIGNDATWNAEHQIQLREYGADRAHGCELLPTRYDLVVSALGGHGEFVTGTEELAPAIERAVASGKPACVNVMVERRPAPTFKRATANAA